jgi:hypothetical protein
VVTRGNWGAILAGLLTLWLVACELPDVTIPGGEPLVAVTAVMRPDEQVQYVIVEQSLDGTVARPDSSEVPVPPHTPRIPIENALVTVANLALPADTCGNPVEFNATNPGIYRAPDGCPTMRPGDRLELRVETPAGEIVTGVTRVPGMKGAFLALGDDSIAMGGGDSVLTFNRDRDTLRLGVDAIVGRLLQLDVRRNGYLSDFGTQVQVDTTEFTLAGSAVNVFVSGAGNEVFRGGRSYVLTLTLADTNFFDFSRSSNNEFTGRGFISHLEGGIGVFGSGVAEANRVWVVADTDDPREGLYRITGEVDGVTIDTELRVYLRRQAEETEVSAFLEGAWFAENPDWGSFGAPRWISKTVAGKSVDGTFTENRLYVVVSDTLPESRFVRYTTLEGLFEVADSTPVVAADSGFVGVAPIGTFVAVRQPLP